MDANCLNNGDIFLRDCKTRFIEVREYCTSLIEGVERRDPEVQ